MKVGITLKIALLYWEDKMVITKKVSDAACGVQLIEVTKEYDNLNNS